MIRLTDPNAEKTVIIDGTSFIIKPLNRQQKQRIQYLWMELIQPNKDNLVEEDEKKFDKAVLLYAKYRSEIDQHKLAELINPAIVKIDHPDFGKLDPVTFLDRAESFWIIYDEIMKWTGLDEETANFSASSSEQSTAAPTRESVVPPVKTEDAPVLIIPEKTEQSQ